MSPLLQGEATEKSIEDDHLTPAWTSRKRWLLGSLFSKDLFDPMAIESRQTNLRGAGDLDLRVAREAL
jgi:hypothetical protein